MVAKQKLGGGVIRGLVGEQEKSSRIFTRFVIYEGSGHRIYEYMHEVLRAKYPVRSTGIRCTAVYSSTTAVIGY